MPSFRFVFVTFLLFFGVASAYSQGLDRHLAAGEFAAAAQMVDSLPQAQRDDFLAQIASAQAAVGETIAAGGTIRDVQSNSSRENAVAAAGGGSFADFQSLIDLIQTTVVPDTWEALGGPSTMREYAQGVYVDPHGTVKECETIAESDAVANLKSLLGGDEKVTGAPPTAWRNPSPMRFVSLRRLLNRQTQTRIDRTPVPESMLYLAGLSQVQYVFIEQDDIFLAGPVGGIESFQGWYRDRQTGRAPLRADFLSTCLASALSNQPFGCTIDPTTEGLQRAAAVATDVQTDRIPIGKAAERIVSALGMQRVEVFGTAGDTPIGYLMVEADRHMKQLALGMDPMPRGAQNYLDIVDATIDRGPPNQLLLRLWFTSAPLSVRADADRTVFEITGTPVRLSGQNERAVASGRRGHITHDFRTAAFVSNFNKNWQAIRTQYPVYSALEAVYRTASIAELLRRFAISPAQQALAIAWAGSGSESLVSLPAPQQVKSIAKLHSVRRRRKVHHVLLASGGVDVNPSYTLTSRIADYPSLSSISKPVKTQPRVLQRWWWDAR